MKNISLIITFLFCLTAGKSIAQDSLSAHDYHKIAPYPEQYTACTVAARIIDGVAFRYYWATDGLRDQDLAFRPNNQARTSMETLRHIYGLSQMIVRAVKKEPNINGEEMPEFTLPEIRKRTLDNLREASEILKSANDADMKDYNIIFKGANGTGELPFWNLLNGPIADALWHIGQVVSFRRSSGNPFSGKVNVLAGTVEK